MKTDRPYVICHMMTTLDGKIASGVDVDVLGDYFDLYTKTEDSLNCRGWLIGRVTMEMFAESVGTELGDVSTNESLDKDNIVVGNEPLMFAVDSKGVLRWKGSTIKLSNVTDLLHLVVLVTNSTPKKYLGYLKEKKISYIFVGEDEIDFNIALNKIKTIFNVEKLLLEGGGILNGSLMSLNLIDEISLLLTPRVLNKSNAPSLFENKSEVIMLKDYDLVTFEKMEKSCVWLRYKVK